MKCKIIGILLLFSISANAQDLLLQTRIEQKTLSALVDKTRILLNNSDIDDQLSGEVTLDDDILFTLDEITSDPNYPKFRDVFSSVFKMDLKSAVIRIRIPKISYQIEELHAKPLSMNVQDPILALDVTAYIRGLTTVISAGIDLDLMIKNPKTDKPESYLTAHLVPTTITIPNTIDPISFNIQFETKRDQEFTYNLKSYDLSAIPTFLDQHEGQLLINESVKKIPLSADSISVNPVIVRLSSLTRTIQFDAFKPLIQNKLNLILSNIISKLGISLQKRIGPKILKSAFSGKTSSDLIVKNDHLYTRFLTSTFSQPVSDQLYLGVTGELCTAELYQQYHEQCHQHGNFPAPVRSVSDGDRQKANSEITDHLARGNSDLILSLSEEYINRLLYVSIQANLWNESLSKQHLTLGPKGAFIVFDQRTQTPELYLDVLYMGEGKGIENLLVNKRKPLRFPLRISTSIDFINQAGIPHMIIKTEKIISDMNEIINGIPQYDLPSHLIFGLKKKVARMILEMSSKIEGQTAIDLDIPVLKNIDLEKSWHEASPFGRLNLFFKL